MYKRIFANVAVRKASIFAVMFALTGVLMGQALVGFSDTELDAAVFAFGMGLEERNLDEVWKPESGTYSEFVMLVQDVNGTTDLEQETVVSIESLLAGDLGEAQFVYLPSIPLSEELQQFTFQRCEELGLEYELVLALMWRESRFQVNAVGYNSNGTKDNGIMQINDVNRAWLAEEHGITDLMDPVQNITAGTVMLADYLEVYDGDVNAALMAYHYGQAGMKRKRAQGITTNSQVEIALDKRDDFRTMIANA